MAFGRRRRALRPRDVRVARARDDVLERAAARRRDRRAHDRHGRPDPCRQRAAGRMAVRGVSSHLDRRRRRAVGGASFRDVRGMPMTLLQDLKFAVRLLIKDKWFTLVAAVALALGIGVNSAVFTFVNAVLIRGLPFDDPDRIIAVGMIDTRGRQFGVSRLDFNDWRDQQRSFSGLSIMQGSPMNVSDEGRPAEQYQGTYQSSNLFDIIGQKPIIGRNFSPENDTQSGEPVVLLSNGLWKNRYGGDPSIVGRTIKVNSRACTVIGVMAPDMKFPFNNDLWVPLSLLPPEVWAAKRS